MVCYGQLIRLPFENRTCRKVSCTLNGGFVLITGLVRYSNGDGSVSCSLVIVCSSNGKSNSNVVRFLHGPNPNISHIMSGLLPDFWTLI